MLFKRIYQVERLQSIINDYGEKVDTTSTFQISAVIQPLNEYESAFYNKDGSGFQKKNFYKVYCNVDCRLYGANDSGMQDTIIMDNNLKLKILYYDVHFEGLINHYKYIGEIV